MQISGRRPSTSTAKSRATVLAPKVDFRSLLSSLKPELLRNPLLAPPKSALLVARRPNCLKLKSSRPSSSQTTNGKLSLAALTPRTKSYTLLTTTYTPRYEAVEAEAFCPASALPLPPRKPLEAPPLPSENSSMMVDRQQLVAVLGGDTGDRRNQYAQAEIFEGEALPMHLVSFPTMVNAYWRPPIPRSRSIKSALPGKRLLRAHSTADFTPTAMSIHPFSIGDSLPQRLQSAKSRVPGLRSVKSTTTMATQTLDSASRKGKIDIYMPEDLHL